MSLMLALAKIGRNPDTGLGAGDVAYRLIHNDTFPSWGFSIKHGATSIWERWNGWTPETGFGDPGMNSFAHYSFGAVYQWMVENIGGIQRHRRTDSVTNSRQPAARHRPPKRRSRGLRAHSQMPEMTQMMVEIATMSTMTAQTRGAR